FTVDSLAPQVTSFSPTGNAIAPLDHFDVTFNEALGGLAATNISIGGPLGPIAAGTPFLVSSNTYRVPFSAQVLSGSYSISILPGDRDLATNTTTTSSSSAVSLTGEAIWDGGGDGTNWTDRFNWVGDRLPGQTDSVVISVAANPTIRIESGTQIVNSLMSDEAI